MAKKTDFSLSEYIESLRKRKTPEIIEICQSHGLTIGEVSDYEMVEALANHSEACTCSTKGITENYLPFEARQVQRVKRTAEPYIAFSFDGKNAVINLDKPFVMPNLETFVEVLFRIAYRNSYWHIEMLSGDEISVAELFANDLTDEIEIDGITWFSGKPWLRESVEKYALAGYNYEILGGSGSPGADGTGWSALCQFHSRLWIYHSDPDEWYDLGEIAVENALEQFKEESEYMREHPELYEFIEWTSSSGE